MPEPNKHRLSCPAGIDCPHLDQCRERIEDVSGFDYKKAFWVVSTAIIAFLLGRFPEMRRDRPLTKAEIIETVDAHSAYIRDKPLFDYKMDNFTVAITTLTKSVDDIKADIAAISTGTGIETKSRLEQRRNLQKQSVPQNHSNAPQTKQARLQRPNATD